MAITLTDAYIKALKAPAKGQTIVYDKHPDAPAGFGIRVTAGGTKSFILRYTSAGKERRMTIGEYGANQWRLAAARKQAGEFRTKINTGSDILQERRNKRAEKTFAQAAEEYCSKHADRLKSGDSVRWVLDKHARPTLGEMKLSDIRRRDIIELVEGIAADRPRAAALALLRIKQVFAFAEDREWIEANPVGTIKPSKVSRNMTPRSRGRVLVDSEIRAFWDAAETCGMHKLTALALKLVLVTGQRPGEVAGMLREEIHGTIWTVPASRRAKTNTEHVVPLTGSALAILEQAKAEVQRLSKRRKQSASSVVFDMMTEPLTTHAMSRAVARYRKDLGNEDADTWGHWTPHDLRRTCRTRLAAEGIGDTVAEAVVGHTRKGIIGVYDRHRYDDEKRAALEAWERRLLRIVGDDTGATTDTAEPPLVPATVEGVS